MTPIEGFTLKIHNTGIEKVTKMLIFWVRERLFILSISQDSYCKYFGIVNF